MTVCTEVLQMFILDFKMSKIKPQNVYHELKTNIQEMISRS